MSAIDDLQTYPIYRSPGGIAHAVRKTIVGITMGVSIGCSHAAPSTLSIVDAIETANAHERRSDSYYSMFVQPKFYEEVLPTCLKVRSVDGSRFDIVFVIDNAGKISQVFKGREGKFVDCIADNLKKVEMKAPPFSPYFAHFDLRVERETAPANVK